MEKKCSGMTRGEECDEVCPLRANCIRYKEYCEDYDPMLFYTYAFGCDDYESIDEEEEDEL